jgi:hypothetical protein
MRQQREWWWAAQRVRGVEVDRICAKDQEASWVRLLLSDEGSAASGATRKS